MIKINNLSYSFPTKELYHNISFTLEADHHCAFIGTSGSGKSTLLDIIMDPERFMYDGVLEMEPNYKIGYVSQFSRLDKNTDITVFEYIAQDFIVLQDQMTSICTEMETSSDIDVLLENYQEVLDAFNAIGGDDYESLIIKQLNLASLTRHKDLKVSELSGGEFKLIQVIKEMLKSPDLMIMDEPDVFLDFENLDALKDLINSHKKALLVITHNRYLLNNCFNKIIHLENTELQEFDGRYIDYNFSLLETKIELQELAMADNEEIERNDNIIDYLRDISSYRSDAAYGRTLKARVKLQERLVNRRIKSPFVDIKKPAIVLKPKTTIESKSAVQFKDYNLAFDESLLENVDFEINSTDKVALIGPNGTGKTTLLREIYKRNNDAITVNPDIEVAYLSQLQGEGLNESKTLLREFLDMGFATNQDVFAYLGEYGFEEDIIHQNIELLSGGEKNILQLAKISALSANMLLLDEPTSHLDTYSQVALEEAINNYNGAVLMISHDYYTIINCMDYVLLVDDKTIRKMSMRKFRKMIYANHFSNEYLEVEKKKKTIEMDIAIALRDNNFEQAKIFSTELEKLNKRL